MLSQTPPVCLSRGIPNLPLISLLRLIPLCPGPAPAPGPSHARHEAAHGRAVAVPRGWGDVQPPDMSHHIKASPAPIHPPGMCVRAGPAAGVSMRSWGRSLGMFLRLPEGRHIPQDAASTEEGGDAGGSEDDEGGGREGGSAAVTSARRRGRRALGEPCTARQLQIPARPTPSSAAFPGTPSPQGSASRQPALLNGSASHIASCGCGGTAVPCPASPAPSRLRQLPHLGLLGCAWDSAP